MLAVNGVGIILRGLELVQDFAVNSQRDDADLIEDVRHVGVAASQRELEIDGLGVDLRRLELAGFEAARFVVGEGEVAEAVERGALERGKCAGLLVVAVGAANGEVDAGRDLGFVGKDFDHGDADLAVEAEDDLLRVFAELHGVPATGGAGVADELGDGEAFVLAGAVDDLEVQFGILWFVRHDII